MPAMVSLLFREACGRAALHLPCRVVCACMRNERARARMLPWAQLQTAKIGTVAITIVGKKSGSPR